MRTSAVIIIVVLYLVFNTQVRTTVKHIFYLYVWIGQNEIIKKTL